MPQNYKIPHRIKTKATKILQKKIDDYNEFRSFDYYVTIFVMP